MLKRTDPPVDTWVCLFFVVGSCNHLGEVALFCIRLVANEQSSNWGALLVANWGQSLVLWGSHFEWDIISNRYLFWWCERNPQAMGHIYQTLISAVDYMSPECIVHVSQVFLVGRWARFKSMIKLVGWRAGTTCKFLQPELASLILMLETHGQPPPLDTMICLPWVVSAGKVYSSTSALAFAQQQIHVLFCCQRPRHCLNMC